MRCVPWQRASSSRAPQRDDGQVLTILEVSRDEFELHAPLAPDSPRSVRRQLASQGEPLPWLEARPVPCGLDSGVHSSGVTPPSDE